MQLTHLLILQPWSQLCNQCRGMLYAVSVSRTKQTEQWVLLAYRLPRVPSTPRSTVWRKLKRLGVAQLADGLVALPADARTREALEWIAEDVVDYGGAAMLWLGQPAEQAGHDAVVAKMTAGAAADYAAVTAEATATRDSDPATRRRILARLRRELHRIDSRDFFAPAERDSARRAVEDLAMVAEREAAQT
jgi:Protein ChrB, N-terminal